MRPTSLRWRFLIGSALWTAGLLACAHFVSIVLMARYPAMTRFATTSSL